MLCSRKPALSNRATVFTVSFESSVERNGMLYFVFLDFLGINYSRIAEIEKLLTLYFIRYFSYKQFKNKSQLLLDER